MPNPEQPERRLLERLRTAIADIEAGRYDEVDSIDELIAYVDRVGRPERRFVVGYLWAGAIWIVATHQIL